MVLKDALKGARDRAVEVSGTTAERINELGLMDAIAGARSKAAEVSGMTAERINELALRDAIKGARDKAVEVGGMTAEKINQLLDDYRKAVATLEALGFEVNRFHVGMGLFPEVNTSIHGSLDKVDDEEIQAVIEENGDKKLLGVMLNALLTAKDFQQRTNLVKFSAVTLDVKLGLPPKVSFDLHEGASV